MNAILERPPGRSFVVVAFCLLLLLGAGAGFSRAAAPSELVYVASADDGPVTSR